MRECLQSLQRMSGLEASILEEHETIGPDALVHFRLPKGQELDVCVEARRQLRPANLPDLRARFERYRSETECAQMLVTAPYVSRPLADRLREEGLWFVDTAGNAYLEIPGVLFVYVVGLRSRAIPLTDAAWLSAQGAKVLFQLLVLGPEVTATYRDIARGAGVSLGLVSRTITALVGRGILARRGRGAYTVANSRRLLDLWCEVYEGKLRPRIFLGRFRAPSGSYFIPLVKTIRGNRKLQDVVIGGELAADLRTEYLRAGSASLYVPTEKLALVRGALNLAPSTEGNVEIYEAFSPRLGEDLDPGGLLVAHPVLVYAELLASADPRCGEAALRLKEKYLPWIP